MSSLRVQNGHAETQANGHANGMANGHAGKAYANGVANGGSPTPRHKQRSPPPPHVAAHHEEADEQNSNFLSRCKITHQGLEYTFDVVTEVVDFLLTRTQIRPTIGIICGSGLGSLADSLSDKTTFPYEDIPHFPVSSVEGHAGELIFGHLEGQSVVCMKGRFHYYEGYPLWKCCMPVRVMKLLGIHTLIATNAAGGLSEKLNVGDIMVLKDHVNLMGFAGNNPLRGANDDRFGPRFPPMSKAYDAQLRKIAKEVAIDMNIADVVKEGVYTCLGGPNYETIAELRLLKLLGVDAVGMSTVHEVTTAVHCGVRCFSFSLITNKCVLDYDTEEEANHEEVVDTGKMQACLLKSFITEFVKRLSSD